MPVRPPILYFIPRPLYFQFFGANLTWVRCYRPY